MTSKSCTRAITRARHELFWLIRDLTVLSQAEIGAIFDRDQSSVLAGVRVTADRLALDMDYRTHVQSVRSYIVDNRIRQKAQVSDAASGLARRVLCLRGADAAEAQHLAITMVGVAAILRSSELTDAEARMAAVQLIRTGGGQAHG